MIAMSIHTADHSHACHDGLDQHLVGTVAMGGLTLF